MRVAIVVFPGTNCEMDTKYAFEQLGFEVLFVWHKETALPNNVNLVVLPGGFSHGDYLRPAAIAKFSPIMKSVVEHADKGGYLLGICNGFQMLLEMHLLPGAMNRNTKIHFVSKFQYLKVANNDNRFLSKLKKNDILSIPIAHADGNYFIDEAGLKSLKDGGQILLTYCDKDGNFENPNGSIEGIAGVCNERKNVFGLMPHPERAMETLLGSIDGKSMLEGFIV